MRLKYSVARRQSRRLRGPDGRDGIAASERRWRARAASSSSVLYKLVLTTDTAGELWKPMNC